jgi:hypothetical protein
MALGPALLATKGFAASEVGDTFARARALAEQLDRPEYQVPLLYGLRLYHTVRSEFDLGLSFATQITQIEWSGGPAWKVRCWHETDLSGLCDVGSSG